MTLSFEQIKEITFGAVRIWQEDQSVHFSKCTEKQIEAWCNIRPIFGERARATTGIKLDFHTNSKSFSFSARSGNKFEIYINGLLSHMLDFSNTDNKSFSTCLDGSENRITLIFPSHEIGVLSTVDIDDNATVIPHRHDIKFLFIGDSITQGYDSVYDSLSYALRVSRFYNAESVIHGVGGSCFEESTTDRIDFDPDVVFVALGTNDLGRDTVEEIISHQNKFMDNICSIYPNKKLIYISPIWRGDFEPDKLEKVFKAEKQVALEHGFFLVDGSKIFPHKSEFMSDVTLHPNALGFGIYAENLIVAIRDLIK